MQKPGIPKGTKFDDLPEDFFKNLEDDKGDESDE